MPVFHQFRANAMSKAQTLNDRQQKQAEALRRNLALRREQGKARRQEVQAETSPENNEPNNDKNTQNA